MLGRQALAQPTSSSALLTQVRSIDALIRAEEPVPLERFRQALILALGDPFGDYNGARASSMADKTLAYIESIEDEDELLWPSEHPDRPADLAYVSRALEPDQFTELDIEGGLRLDSGELVPMTEGSVDRWMTMMFGPPPWQPRKRRGAPVDDEDEVPPSEAPGENGSA